MEPITCLYQAKGAKLIINTDLDEWFSAVCKVLKCGHLQKDPRFKEQNLRVAPDYDYDTGKLKSPMGENFPALQAEIQKLVAELDADTLCKKLDKAGVPVMKT